MLSLPVRTNGASPGASREGRQADPPAMAAHERGAGGGAWARARNVLAIRLDQMGDVLMTTPALNALRQGAADRRVTLLGSAAAAGLAGHLPVDAVMTASVPWMKAAPAAQVDVAAASSTLIERLRAQSFDAAVIFTTFSQSALPAALLCVLAGIPLRLGHSRENPYGLLTDWVADHEPQAGLRHEVERQLALVSTVVAVAAGNLAAMRREGGGAGAARDGEWAADAAPRAAVVDRRLHFGLAQADRAGLARVLARRDLSTGTPYLVLHPGASAASRRYPAAQFGAALRLLHAHAPLPVFITGSAQERDLAVEVREHAGASAQPALHDLTGALSLGELGALIESARLLIANNSGPTHLAAALGTPVVDLYALTNPQHTPWQVPARVLFHDVACRYCMKSVCPEGHHQCLRGVTPLQVAQAARELLAVTGRGDARPARRPEMPAAECLPPFSARRWNDAWRVVSGPQPYVAIRPEPKVSAAAAQRCFTAHPAVGR